MMLDTAEKLAIHELLGRAAYGLDERKLEMLEQCFAPDADMVVRIAEGDTVGPFEGREAIMQLMTDSMAAQTDTRRHVISNIFFEAEDEDAATVVSNLTLFTIEHGLIKVLTSGFYRDNVIKHDGSWKFASRQLDLDLPY